MLPAVNLTTLDNQLGIRPPTGGDRMVVVGPSSTGPFNTPATYTRIADVVAAFGAGPLVEAAAYAIERYGDPVAIVRCEAEEPADYGDLDTDDFAGTSVPTIDDAIDAIDEFEAYIVFVAGGTIGTAGITYRWSLDGGRTLSPVTALGTATSIVIPTSGGVKVDFAAGTIVTGSILRFRALPAWPTPENLADAFEALRLTNLVWAFAQVCGPLGDLEVSAIGAKLAQMEAGGKHRWAIGNTRPPDEDETEAQYRDGMAAMVAAAAEYRVMLVGGYAEIDSSISRRRYFRAPSVAIAARAGAVAPHIDLAEVDLGPLPGVRIRDENGNPKHHDEAAHPGLDDLRLVTLRTDTDFEGVYVTNPRILAPTGSDFIFLQYRRVMDIACDVIRAFLKRRLSKAIRLDKKTGLILEGEALEIESGANARLRDALLTTPYASGARFVLSRTDNVLSTLTLNGTTRVVPLAYPKFFEVTMGFHNPALQIEQV